MQLKILEFIDSFYETHFKEEAFEKWKVGALSRKKNGFIGVEDESKDLYTSMVDFNRDPAPGVEWDTLEKEIECIENYCTFDRCKAFYKKLFAP